MAKTKAAAVAAKPAALTIADDITKRMADIIGEKATPRCQTNEAHVLAGWRYARASIAYKIAEAERDQMKEVLVEHFKPAEQGAGYKATVITHRQFSLQCEVRKGQNRFDQKALVSALTSKGWKMADIMELITLCTTQGASQVLLSGAFSTPS
jgi:hypothetical protein